MDFPEVARRRKVDCRSGDERERTSFGTEIELKITADPVNTEPVDRPQAIPVLVTPFQVRHKDIVQFGYTPGDADRNRIVDDIVTVPVGQQVHTVLV